jgi:hypothetical protein
MRGRALPRVPLARAGFAVSSLRVTIPVAWFSNVPRYHATKPHPNFSAPRSARVKATRCAGGQAAGLDPRGRARTRERVGSGGMSQIRVPPGEYTGSIAPLLCPIYSAHHGTFAFAAQPGRLPPHDSTAPPGRRSRGSAPLSCWCGSGSCAGGARRTGVRREEPAGRPLPIRSRYRTMQKFEGVARWNTDWISKSTSPANCSDCGTFSGFQLRPLRGAPMGKKMPRR